MGERSDLEPAMRIEVELEPERRGAGEIEHHGLAPRRRQPRLDRLAHQLGAVAIGQDQPCLVGNDVAGEVGIDREIEPVAKFQIVLPFAVGLIIEQAGFDLDDQMSPPPDSATTSARRPLASDSSVTTDRPSTRKARHTPRCNSAATGDCRRSNGMTLSSLSDAPAREKLRQKSNFTHMIVHA